VGLYSLYYIFSLWFFFAYWTENWEEGEEEKIELLREKQTLLREESNEKSEES